VKPLPYSTWQQLADKPFSRASVESGARTYAFPVAQTTLQQKKKPIEVGEMQQYQHNQ